MPLFDPELAPPHDPRLAALATGAWPAWLWSTDGSRILWANAVAAAVFGAPNVVELRQRRFKTNDIAAAQVLRLGATLPSRAQERLERLRGFGAGFGRALTCICSRIAFEDGTAAVLIVAAEAAGPALTLSERVRRLFAVGEDAVAAFGADGTLVYANAAAHARLRGAASLAALGLAGLAVPERGTTSACAQFQGIDIGVTAARLGKDDSRVLLLTFAPQPLQQTQPPPSAQPTQPPAAEERSERQASATAAPPGLQTISAPEPVDAPPAVEPLRTPEVAADTSRAAVEPARESISRLTAGDEESSPPEPARNEAPIPERRHPLRFVWHMDSNGHFVVGSDEFIELVGPHTMARAGRRWSEITSEINLDSEGQVARAMATRETWSGITVSWPVDGSSTRLPVELSGLPVFDRDRTFRGYRGFGVCRDLERINALNRERRQHPAHVAGAVVAQQPAEAPAAAAMPESDAAEAPVLVTTTEAAAENGRPEISVAPAADEAEAAEAPTADEAEAAETERPAISVAPAAHMAEEAEALAADEGEAAEAPAADEVEAAETERPEISVAPAANVVPFRQAQASEPKTAPALSPVERRAFRELAQELTARLRDNPEAAAEDGAAADVAPTDAATTPAAALELRTAAGTPVEQTLLDRIPLGILLYRHDSPLFANRHFLEWTGYPNLDAIKKAGGLDALFAGREARPTENGGPQTLAIRAQSGSELPAEGRMCAVPWQGNSALALVVTGGRGQALEKIEHALAAAERENRSLKFILNRISDCIVMLDRRGVIESANARAAALFGKAPGDMTGCALGEFLAPESERVAREYFERVAAGGDAGAIDVAARAGKSRLIPLALTLAHIGEDRFAAMFHDITANRQSEEELRDAKREAAQATAAKTEFLTKVSHEIRTPLNAITGFAEIIIAERFGPIGNERYREYVRDIHEAGTQLVAMLNDLVDLSRIESGKGELNFANVSLNALTQQCVGIMQPQANKARIIIRTALTPALPQVVADERSMRQIVLNLLSNSIKLTGPGGQVIVSTAFSDAREAVLRVRDTGAGMSDKDIQAVLEPFHDSATSARFGSGGASFGLPLTKAIAEANRAHFSISSAPNAGTLVEIAFPPSRVVAE